MLNTGKFLIQYETNYRHTVEMAKTVEIIIIKIFVSYSNWQTSVSYASIVWTNYHKLLQNLTVLI